MNRLSADIVCDGAPHALSECEDDLLSAHFGKPMGLRDLWSPLLCFFGIDERRMGALDPWTPFTDQRGF